MLLFTTLLLSHSLDPNPAQTIGLAVFSAQTPGCNPTHNSAPNMLNHSLERLNEQN